MHFRQAAGATTMRWAKLNQPAELEDLPNLGEAIAADLRRAGIHGPAQLARRDPVSVFRALSKIMGKRHDPCVLYTLLAVHPFLKSGAALPWWKFTAAGQTLLRPRGSRNKPF